MPLWQSTIGSMRGPHRTPTVLAVLLAIVAAAPTAEAQRRPNLVFILADNQWAWMLGSYGNPDIRTPNIDRLAGDGIRFTRALSSNPVCSPTRATFLTGLLPSQPGVHSFLDPRYMMGPEAYNTLAEFTSLGVIPGTGYSTPELLSGGAIGTSTFKFTKFGS